MMSHCTQLYTSMRITDIYSYLMIQLCFSHFFLKDRYYTWLWINFLLLDYNKSECLFANLYVQEKIIKLFNKYNIMFCRLSENKLDAKNSII